MLLGGMSVMGAYVWASEASFKATSPAVLSQVSASSFHCFPPYANATVQPINSSFSYQTPLAHTMLPRDRV
jgi:hypothetical protein